MSKNIRTQIGKVIGKTLNSYHARVKPVIDDIKFKEQYQGRIIDCMVGEVDDNYIETPETDSAIVKLEHSKEGLVKVPSIKGKTILVDADGNETDTPAEGCRLVSVGEEEDNKLIILSKNKNLFDGQLVQGSISASDGLNNNNANGVRTDFIRIKQEDIYISGLYSSVYSFVAFYDKDKKYIKRTPAGNNGGMILQKVDNPAQGNTNHIPIDCAFIKLTQYPVGNQTSTYDDIVKNTKNIQIEYNSQTSYVKPKHHKTEILLDEPLRGLPNGVCDEIIGNKLIRRIGRVKFDNTKNYHNGNHLENTLMFRLPMNNIKSTNVICNMVATNKGGAWNIDEELIYYYNVDKYLDIRVNRNRLTTQDLLGFKQWVSENLVEVLYELEEPIIEELANSITLQGYDDTTMYVENSIAPTISYGYNALIPYKEELLNQKEEVETNTLDIENNIIPYLMDMEFNLMLMEDNE